MSSRSRRQFHALILAAACTTAGAGGAKATNLITDNYTGGAAPNNEWFNSALWSAGVFPNDDPVNKYITNIPANVTVVLQDIPGLYTTPSDTVYDLNLAASTVNVEVPLTVEDAINGSGSVINVLGSTLNLSAQAANAANPANIYVTSGGTATLGYSTVTFNNGGTTLSADGTGSVMNLSSAQTISYGIPNNGNNYQYYLSATDGANVNLSGLTSITRLSQYDTLNIDSSNGGTFNFSSLQTINVDGQPGANYTTDTTFSGVSFSLPALTTARYTLFDLSSGRSFSAPKLTDADNSEIEISGGGTFTTGSISDLDNADIFITGGATFGQGINPVTATSITLNNGTDTLSADGNGSILNLSSVQTLAYGIPNTGNNFQYTVSATDGATVNLSGLTSITRLSPYDTLNFDTSNGGAINLNGLQSINVDGQPGANYGVDTKFGGSSFSLPALTTARYTLFDLTSGTSISAPKLTDADNSEIEIAGGGTFTTGSVSDLDNATILITGGATFGQGINPVSATSITLNNGADTLSADGTGSILNLSSVQTLAYGIPNNGNNFQYTVSATNGAAVNLAGLTSITRLSPYDTLNIDSSNGGTFNLSSLQTINVDNQPGANYTTDTTFSGISFFLPALTTARYTLFDLTSGRSFSAPKLTDVDNSEIEISGGGTFTTGSISDIDNSDIFITGGATFGQGINPVTATSITLNNGTDTLSADGTGSILNLSSVQTLSYGIPNNGNNFQYTVSATNGATVNLSGLTSITRLSPYDTLNFDTSNGGAINLNGLQSINVDAQGFANYGVDTKFSGSSFSLPALTTARYTLFNLTSGTSISAPKLTDVDNSEIEVAGGGTFTTGSISDIDNATILITGGATFGQGINPVSATSITLNNGGDTLSSDGTGSILNLSSVQTLSYGIPNNGNNFQYTVSATSGATINLSGLTSITRLSPYDTLNFDTANGGTINLNALQSINVDSQGGANYGTQTHFNGNSFSLPALGVARYTLFDLTSNTSISAPKLYDIDNSEVEVAGGGLFTTGSITNVDNASILVTSGGTFGQGINPVSAIAMTLNNGGNTLSADGTGSILNLSSLKTLAYGVANNGSNFQYLVSATSSANVNLSGLVNINNLGYADTLTFDAFSGGTINLGNLQSVNAAPTGEHTVFNIATAGQLIAGGSMIGQLLQTQYTAFNVTDATGKLDFPSHLTLGTGSSFNIASGAVVGVQGNFVNTLTSTAAFQASGAVIDMDGLGVQTLEAAGADVGAIAPGNNGNFGFGQLQIGLAANAFPTEVDLVDNFNNGNRGTSNTPEALYLLGADGQSGLVLNNGSVLVLGNLNAYSFEAGTGTWLSLQSLFGPGQTIVPFTMNGSSGFLAKNLSTLQDSWVNSGSGSWNTASNWSLGTVPSDLNDTFITTSASLTVAGPSAVTRVRSLTVNGPAAGPATVLNLPGPGTVNVNTTLAIGSKGQVNLQGGILNVQQLNVQGALTVATSSTFGAGAITSSGTINNAGNFYVTNAFTNNSQYAQTAGRATFAQILGTGSFNVTGGTAVLTGIGLPSQTNGLFLSGTGTLDITTNSLAVNYTAGSDPYATIRGYLKSASDGGIWNGVGLTSSTVETEVANAIKNGGGVYGIGYADGAKDANQHIATGNQIVYEPALIGDANLDGSVTFVDLGIVAQNLGATNADWVHGDFNYDGTVNFLDIGLLAQNLNKTTLNTPISELVPDPSPALTAQWNLAVAEIEANQTQPADLPEPGMISLLGVAAGGLMMRRRRR